MSLGATATTALARADNPDTDGTDELAATITELGGPDPWASRIGNRRPTSTAAGAPLKAETIAQLTETLPAQGVRTAADLRAAAATADTLKAVERAWRATPGQRSGITWDYALMLAQIPGPKIICSLPVCRTWPAGSRS